MNRTKLEKRIWGKSIASARTNGLISEEEAKFLLDEYLKEFKAKKDWKSQNFGRLFGSTSRERSHARTTASYQSRLGSDSPRRETP